VTDNTYALCCCLIGQHNLIKVYDRPWRNWFRRRIFWACLRCGCHVDG
jgi:hypothetical protein